MSPSSSWLRAAPFLLLPLAPILVVWLLPGADPESNSGDGALPARRVFAPGDPGGQNPRFRRPARGARRGETSPGEVDAGAAQHAPPPEAVSDLSRAVWGRVLTPAGRPVSRARVSAHRAPFPSGGPGTGTEPLAEAESGDDGAFHLTELPRSPLAVWAEARGFAPAWVLLPGPGVEVHLEVDAGGALRVHVKGADGQALPDARVVYLRRDFAREAPTAPDGWADLLDLPIGPARLRAYDARGRFTEVTGRVAEGPPRTLECVVRGGWRIAGQVLDAGSRAPVDRALVSVNDPGPMGGVAAEDIRTGGDGRFHLTLQSDDLEEVVLLVAKAGFARHRLRVARPANDVGLDGVEILLGPARPVTGWVIDAAGSSVSEATIWWAGQLGEVVVSDRNGTFQIDLPGALDPDVHLVLAARHPEHGLGTRVLRPGSSALKDVVLGLTGVGRIWGQVLDEARHPRAGSILRLEPARSLSAEPGDGSWSRPRALASLPPDALHATTDAEGGFDLPGVPVGAYRLRVTSGGSETLWPEPLEVAAGEAVEAEVILPETRVISGWVVGSQGDPISGAGVSAWPRFDLPTSGSLTTVTRQDGRFELRGASGDGCWELVARVPGYPPGRLACAHAGDRGVEIRIGAAGAVLGFVRDLDGNPYSGPLRVCLAQSFPPAPSGGSADVALADGSAAGWHAVEVRAGSFRIHPVTPAPYVVRGEVEGGVELVRPAVVQVPSSGEPREVNLRLVRGGGLQGVVSWEESGAPIAGARVVLDLRLADGNRSAAVATARTDTSGRYALTPLAPATYRMRIQAAFARPFERQVEVRGEGETEIEDARLRRID